MGRRAETKLFKWKELKQPNGKNWYMIQGRPTGKRERYYFETEKEAKKAEDDRNRQITAFGSQIMLPDPERVMAAECIKMLAPFGKTLYDATHFYRDFLQRQTSSITVAELCDRVAAEFDRRLSAGEASKKHYLSMRETLKKFRAKFAGVYIKLLEGNEIKVWLAHQPLAIKTRNRHLGYIRNIFGIAREWKLIGTDPFEHISGFRDPAKKARKTVIKLSPEEMRRFLSALDKDWLPFFSIYAFTGLRCEEVELLDWSEVKLDRSLIDLPWDKSKNGKRKLEEVPDNLLAILTPFAKPEGPVRPKKKLQHARENAAHAAGLWPWKQNCIRHSFCSYAVATKGFTWTSLQSDHSEAILKRDYWEVVSKEDAAKYWAITI